MSEWQQIETAPKDQEPVLLWEPPAIGRHDGLVHVGAYSLVLGWTSSTNGRLNHVTRWQPLPEPPT